MEQTAKKDIETRAAMNEMFVTFNLGDEIFGIDVMKVEEIIGFIHVTRIPESANYLKGVINLRGRVVPVIDLRLKFMMDEKSYDSLTVIIIVNVENRSVGLIADSVSDVADIPCEMIHDYSNIDKGQKKHFIRNIANFNDDLILIMNIDNLMDEIDIPAEEANDESVSVCEDSLVID